MCGFPIERRGAALSSLPQHAVMFVVMPDLGDFDSIEAVGDLRYIRVKDFVF